MSVELFGPFAHREKKSALQIAGGGLAHGTLNRNIEASRISLALFDERGPRLSEGPYMVGYGKRSLV